MKKSIIVSTLILTTTFSFALDLNSVAKGVVDSVTKEQTVWLEIFKRYEKQLVARREELKLDQPTQTQENKEDSKKVEQNNYDEVDDPV